MCRLEKKKLLKVNLEMGGVKAPLFFCLCFGPKYF
nr:MAG TPA_asm: hypothetical protein [Caudoviricetes sp.]